MRAMIGVFVILFTISISPELRPSANPIPENEDPCCQMARDALEAKMQLKVGMKRKDVEKQFELDGGMQFPESSTYVVPSCEYFKVKIEFKQSTPNEHSLSPEDTVTKISQLFVAYPAKD